MLEECAIQGCTEKHRAKGYCGKHYKQWRKGRLGETIPRDGAQGCKVAPCAGRHEAMGFCSKHYKRWRRGTISIEGIEVKKRPPCRVVNCPQDRYMSGYCEQHFKRLLLMKELWMNKVMPTHATRGARSRVDRSFLAEVIKLEDIRADLDYDYITEW